MGAPSAIVFAASSRALPEVLGSWIREQGLKVLRISSPDELMQMALRGRPRLVVLDARKQAGAALELCVRLKRDSFTGVVPVVAVAGDLKSALRAFDAGADEALHDDIPTDETRKRLDVLLRRSDRDTRVHPSTQLGGADAIESEIARRIATGELFAVCYADLDYFKEYNDRYSYTDGDRVIRMLARILHDVVKGICGEEGFVGHIGGDDFIYIIPLWAVNEVSAIVVEVFDELTPYQYSEQDRRAGYFFGKDRRGQLHRVPLMTVSVGIVTNERRRFVTAAQVSELATEMKSYAKTLPGSLYTIDRRQDAMSADDRRDVDPTAVDAAEAK